MFNTIFILTFAGKYCNSSIVNNAGASFTVMNIIDFIINRRSIRKYLPEAIPDELIGELLKAGMYAPSAVNKQPWHFIVIRERSIMEEIIKVHPYASMLRFAAAAIVVCGDMQIAHTPEYTPVDCAAATQNILLAAHGLGLGGVWLGLHPREERKRAISILFGLPDNIMPFAIVSLGYPAEMPPLPQRFRKERIHYEKW
ncbi:MAG: nitroreductase family protein [Bacteroidales bacterium]